jgi:hypothetical protein
VLAPGHALNVPKHPKSRQNLPFDISVPLESIRAWVRRTKTNSPYPRSVQYMAAAKKQIPISGSRIRGSRSFQSLALTSSKELRKQIGWMKKGEVRELICETLKAVIATGEFQLKKGHFVRRITGGTQTLGVPLWDYSPKFEFSFTMTMRLDAVEEITNRFSGSPPKYHSGTQTILTQLEHLGLTGCRWQAETEDELALRLVEASTFVQDRVIPFFQRYQNLLTIAVAANPETAPVVPPTPNGMTTGMGILADGILFRSGKHPYRAMSAITLAHLARFENFDVLVSRYRGELHSLHHQSERDKFDQLVQFLRESEKAV